MQWGYDVLWFCNYCGGVADAHTRARTGMFATFVGVDTWAEPRGESVGVGGLVAAIRAAKAPLGDQQLTKESPCIVLPPRLITQWPEMGLDEEFLLLPVSIVGSPRATNRLETLIGGGCAEWILAELARVTNRFGKLEGGGCAVRILAES